ncbi:hypothetical protein PG985_001444 [Apiospora marii]|uniref:uncharacterized protein n=1 Tax=Apiospora marii TaxID=335849 RepID=UPI003131BAC2
MANRRFRAAALMVAQVTVTLVVVLVFAMAFAAQTGTITMPTWADTWQGVPAHTRTTYAASLLGTVCFIFVLFFGAGLLQMMREARSGT